MKYVKPSRAWRPVRAGTAPRAVGGVWLAFVFNLCLTLLPLAAASALYVTNRDQLYAYQFSEAGARAVRARIEDRLGSLIQLDFDRRRQWDDLVAMELMAGDVAAARGFLLSARHMLTPRDANIMDRRLRTDASDAQVEIVALDLLTPGTRARYEATVPLLSRHAAGAVRPQAEAPPALGDAGDFELLSRALLTDPTTDPLHFAVTGLSLNVRLTPRERLGAAALLAASRRDDYPDDFAEEMRALLARAVALDRFRAAALAGAEGGDAGGFENAVRAFRASLSGGQVAAARAAFDEIGAASEATSLAAAARLITHAHGLKDLPRLRLLAQTGGDRAAAAAKRLPRDTGLARLARGKLEFSRDLASILAIAGLAFAGLLFCVGYLCVHAGRRLWLRLRDDTDEEADLIDAFSGAWRPL